MTYCGILLINPNISLSLKYFYYLPDRKKKKAQTCPFLKAMADDIYIKKNGSSTQSFSTVKAIILLMSKFKSNCSILCIVVTHENTEILLKAA